MADLARTTHSSDTQTQQNLELMSAYYLDLERLLDRVDRSATHYQVLGLQRLATQEDIKKAYREAIKLLHPSQNGINVAIPQDMMSRIDAAFERVTQAFSILSNLGKRVSYDNMIMPKTSKPLAINTPIPQPVKTTPPKTQESPAQQSQASPSNEVKEEKEEKEKNETLETRTPGTQRAAFTRSKKDVKDSNRRRCERFKLSIPARTMGCDRVKGKWSELTQTVDVSRTGVSLMTRRRVRYGMVLYLSLPMPVKLRGHGFSDQTYNVYGLVRRIEPIRNGTRVIGVEFLGEHPPVGYLEKPWVTFRTQNWSGIERRRQDRLSKAEPVTIEYLDEDKKVIRQEVGVTENLSRTGARVYLKAAPPEFDFVKVTNLKRNFESIATVRNRFMGRDGFERLCLRFMDAEWPV